MNGILYFYSAQMKTTLTLFFVLLFAFGKAQDGESPEQKCVFGGNDTVKNNKFSIGYWFIKSSAYDVGHVIYFMHNRKKHSFFAGVAFSNPNTKLENATQPEFIGGYRFNPRSKKKHFSFSSNIISKFS